MKTLLMAMNSKYIHTNLALRDLLEYGRQRGIDEGELLECTINQRLPQILEQVYRRKPNLLLLSCYIWNIRQQLDLAAEYKLIDPAVRIVLGGPEVSYNSAQVLRENPAVEAVLCGEGEEPYVALRRCLAEGGRYGDVPSLTWRDGEDIVENPWAPETDLAQLPFPYPDLGELKDKIFYFESIRGCPFRCSYCLSSVVKTLRFMPLEMACGYLQRFLDAKVPQVKFVDRTFNCNKEHALGIWRYLVEHDNGVTNFHFELTANLLDQEMLDFLATVRPGLFQFEIGVQSTNEATIREIRRAASTKRILEVSRCIDSWKNIHLHLDLIAGLPYEDFDSFGRSFDDVMAIRPQQLQLGFLKILKGSYMAQKAPDYGMVYSQQAPYQVYRTNWLSFEETLLLEDTAEVVDLYYNSGLYSRALDFCLEGEGSAFGFFRDLGQRFRRAGYFQKNPSPEEKLSLLRDFFLARREENARRLPLFEELCLYDLCRHGKPKKLPDWLSTQGNRPYKEAIDRFFDLPETIPSLLPEYGDEEPKKVQRLAHLQVFDWDPRSGEEGPCALLFNYRRRDLLGNAAVTAVELPALED